MIKNIFTKYKDRDCYKVSTVDVREHFSETVNHVAYGKKNVVLTRRGKPLAILTPIENIDKVLNNNH